jgi:hypothetical protein
LREQSEERQPRVGELREQREERQSQRRRFEETEGRETISL